MDEQQFKQTIATVVMLHQELQKQSTEALNLQRQGIRQLEIKLDSIDRLVSDKVSQRIDYISGDLRREIAKGGKQGLADFDAQIFDLKKKMSDFSTSAKMAQTSLDSVGKSILFKIACLSVVALICVIGVSIWQGWYYRSVIREKANIVKDLDLFQRADIVKCGGRICAKINRNTPSEFSKDGYFLIESE